ncbi:MAG: PAS domain-containing protein [Bacteroidia bacterium]|nr:PAS domain-containing protein [Bacteroidia bacterium]
MTDLFLSELPVAITVSDKDGKILYMNKKSAKVFENYGGEALIGTNLKDYHNQVSNSKIAEMLSNNTTNAYTIEKNGIKKMIYQAPWNENGKVMGMIEFSFEIPVSMNHFVRK